MSSSNRLSGAVEIFFTELAESLDWHTELQRETDRAHQKCQSLITTTRAAIESLPRSEHARLYDRLRALAGQVAPKEPDIRRPTERTTLVRTWLRDHAPTEFHTSDLRAWLEQHGHRTRHNYVGTLMGRFADRGVVTRTGYGTYRVNREHGELAGS
ncbi:MAG: hypothetical protein AAF293_00565 [Pseudomonadota bacterium]